MPETRHVLGPTYAVLGLRQNLAQFMLLVAVNALVGGTLGQERTVLPLLASQEFNLDLHTSALTYILAFGLAKAAMNYFAGTLADRCGRKPVLVAGWLVAIPVPLMLIFGPSWGWIVTANVLLGVSQGLTWSTAVIMKMDLTGPKQRGLAMGLNEAAGYLGVALTALATGYIASAYGLRPGPFLLGAAYIALGLGLSVLTVRETHRHARTEASQHVSTHSRAHAGLTTGQVLAAVYTAVWGAAQLLTGAASDRWSRKWFISLGMIVQAVGLAIVAASNSFGPWLAAVVLLGLGTAMV